MKLPTSQQAAPKEHDCMGEMAEAIQKAHDCAALMSHLRPDQRDPWTKVAVLLKTLQGQCYDLASGGLLSREDGQYSGGPFKQ